MISLEKISKAYYLGNTSQPVLKNISFTIKKGEVLSIIGASGSGKSTLMNIIGLLDSPTSGKYYLNGQDVSSLNDDKRSYIRNQMIGFVFQSFFLLPRFNALQNVCLPLSYRRINQAEVEYHAMAMLKKVGMENRAYHKPNQLSGGQQQRVAIARALVGKPSVILADEPTGALDSAIGQEIMDLFLNLNTFENTSLVIITHDHKIADQCQRVIQINDGEIV